MKTKSFKEIRAQYSSDDDFLVLVGCETRNLLSGDLEVLGALHVEPFKDFQEMYNAYRDYRKKGLDVHFVIPQYKDNFIIEQHHRTASFSSKRLSVVNY